MTPADSARSNRAKHVDVVGRAPLDAPPPASHVRRRQRLKLLAILLVCAAPVVASYLAYYVFPPAVRTHVGELIEPQRPVGAFQALGADGAPLRLDSLRGRWVLLQVDRGACGQPCVEKLYAMRQQRTMTGKDRERIERVWLIVDAEPVAAQIGGAYEGTLMLRADPAAAAALLPVGAGRGVEDYLYLIDPLGNLMMRFPRDADPNGMKRDLAKLLKASRVG